MDRSPALLSWARRYGINLDDFSDLDVRPGRYLVTVGEAARELSVGEEQVRRLLRSGTLFGVPLGGRNGWRVSRDSIAEYRHSPSGAAGPKRLS